MSVGMTNDGRYYAQYRVPHKTNPVKVYFGHGAEGQRKAAKHDRAVKRFKVRGEVPRSSVMYFKKLAQLYMEHTKVQGKSEKFRRQMVTLINDHWLEKLNGVPVSELNSIHFNAIGAMYADKSPSTSNRYITYLNVIFNFGKNHGYIPDNPMQFWRREMLKPEGKRELTIGDEEIRAILKAAKPHVYKAVKLAVKTGARPGPSELFKLKYADIDYEAKTIHIRGTKTASSDRHVPLDDDMLAALQCWQFSATTEYIVEFRGKPVTSIKRSFRKAVEEAGITDKIVPYHLRHYFGSVLLRNGADVTSVAKLMGHTSPNMLFTRYSHVINHGAREAIKNLPKFR